MSKIILIIGRSGSGKSTSLRNYVKGEVAVISVLGKELPFRTTITPYVAPSYEEVVRGMAGAVKKGIKTIFIDDVGYLITHEFMATTREKGYEKFGILAENFYNLIQYSQSLPADVNVYLTMHEEVNEFGGVKPKTIGKMLDEKVVIEGYFTIVLRAAKEDGKHIFRTRTDGIDVVKTPIGMFENESIDNDLKAVDQAIRDFYKPIVEDKPKEDSKEEPKQVNKGE